VYASKEPTIHKDVPALEGSFDIVVIDGAPRLEAMATSAIKAADLVLIPVQPSAADIWAAEDIIDLIRARQDVTGGLPRAAFVVSRQVVGSNLADTVQAALEAFDVPVLQARTSQRVAYAEALGAGLSVIDVNATKAEEEVQQLAKEALTYINGQHG
jgi:chromosome partitioning protein